MHEIFKAALRQDRNMKLNLGEGPKPIPGYIGVDRLTGQEVYPLEYPDNSVEEIYAAHLLEHFTPPEIVQVLADWVRVLQPGGVIKIAVPDFALICAWYQGKRYDKPLHSYLMGGQTNPNDFHKSIFDYGALKLRMEEAGLSDVKHWRPIIDDTAALEVSLNLQGTKPMKKNVGWPASEARNVFSQFGEDGILEAVFAKIGVTNRYCVDVGAADGLLFSNVRQFVEQGWFALLIESDRERFDNLVGNSGGQFGEGRVKCFNYCVEPAGLHSLDKLLEKAGAPVELDLLNIDVDGQDYYIWNSLLRYHPRVVVIEYSPESDSMYIPPLGGAGQAGWNATTFVAAARGYYCICRTQTNLICVRKDILEALPDVRIEVGYNQKKTPPLAIPSAPEPESDKPVKVVAVISVPRLGFNDNWHATIKALTQLQIEVQLVFGVFWGQVLTRGIQQAIASGADIILTIDYDTVFDVQHVIKICQLLGDYPEYSAIVPVQVKRECNELLFGLDSGQNFDGPVTPISSGHFGLTAIDAHAFSRMSKPWFHDQPNADGEWGDGRVDADIFFWRQFAAAGLKAGLANQVRIGHLELAVSWPTADFHIVRQSITDYRNLGQPEAAGGRLPIELMQ